MLRYKITAPALPHCVERPRLLEQVLSRPVIVLVAPAGHGKTCLAAQIAAATGGPVAWFVADELDRDRAGVVTQLVGALGAAWPDLRCVVPGTPAEAAAVPLLGAVMETLAGPGCVVLDDVHLLPVDVLEPILHTAIATLSPDFRLVVCTRSAHLPEPLLRAEATGRVVVLGPGSLAFDEEECGRVCGSVGRGADVHARTGGWPLAVALWAQRHGSRDAPRVDRREHLAACAVAELNPPDRDLLTVLARLPRFPVRLLRRLRERGSELETFGRRNPVLLPLDDGWWAPREWLRDALNDIVADQCVVDTVARALVDLDERELAAQLLLAEARFEDAAPIVEQLAADGTRRGRAAWVRALIEAVPASARTFELDLLHAAAAQSLNAVGPDGDAACSESKLLRLVDHAAAVGADALLRAQALLAGHYRMEGDARLFAVCDAALGPALRGDVDATRLRVCWSPDATAAAAELLRYYGHALLLANDRDTVERGTRLVATALALLDDADRPTTSQRGWSAYIEVLLFLRRPADGIGPLRLAAHRLTELDHNDAALRLAELATVAFLAGDRRSARRAIEMARDTAARMANRIVLAPLASIEVALDVLDDGAGPEHCRRFDDVAAELAAHPRLAHFTALITAEFGIVLVRCGQADLARHYLERAEAALGTTFFAHTSSLRCRRLRGLLLLAEESMAEGRAVLGAVRDEAADEGRGALVELLDADLSEHPRRGPGAGPPVVVHVLAPTLAVTLDGEALPTPRGYPAKLLALLVAADGSLTIDAAIEGLWPGADPDVGRNRLHGVILRLRRGLGLSADGPIECTDGIVRLDRSSQLKVDSWEFQHLAAAADMHPEASAAAVAAYRGDVLSVQFAYDDSVAAYRRLLRRTFLRSATAMLADPPADASADVLAAVARRAWDAAPDDDDVCLAAVRALARVGRRAEARELVEGTARALGELGLDSETFRHRGLLEAGMTSAVIASRERD